MTAVVVVTQGLSEWTIVPARSFLEFRLDLPAGLAVSGFFRDVRGRILFDEEDAGRSRVDASVDAASIETGLSAWDARLRSAAFLDVARFPLIRFNSKRIARKDAGRWLVTAGLTIRDVTREVNFVTELQDVSPDGAGECAAILCAQGEIRGRDFGLSGPLLGFYELGGDRVTVEMLIEARGSQRAGFPTAAAIPEFAGQNHSRVTLHPAKSTTQ
jgi:polyisoprenoid-binding protein YceI